VFDEASGIFELAIHTKIGIASTDTLKIGSVLIKTNYCGIQLVTDIL
jgi:hypothetical protein